MAILTRIGVLQFRTLALPNYGTRLDIRESWESRDVRGAEMIFRQTFGACEQECGGDLKRKTGKAGAVGG